MASYNFKAMKYRKRYIKPEQVEALFEYFYNKESRTEYIKRCNINKAYLIYTLWRTGRRVSEIVGDENNIKRMPGLRPMDFDDETQEISFSILKKNPVKSKTKTGQPRPKDVIEKEKFNKDIYIEAIAYDTEYYETMREYIIWSGIEEHERIFPYKREYVDQFIKKAALDLKLHLGLRKVLDPETNEVYIIKQQVSPHCFRHGFSMNFLANNSNNPNALPLLQELLVHSNINVTKTYLKFNQEDKRKALNKTFGVESEP